jgi:hypothetical protein
MEMRLLKAVSLLRDADAKIINVADQCGFNHLGLFNTCFKRRFGMSPGQWRKSKIQSEGASARKLENKARTKCPLLATGSCPLGGKIEGFHPAAMSTIAGKFSGGPNILEDLKRRDLTFGTHALSKGKGDFSEAMAGG